MPERQGRESLVDPGLRTAPRARSSIALVIDLLLEAGHALTVGGPSPVIEDAALAIDDGVIVAVGPAHQVTASYEARDRISLPHGVMMPGLVDAHSHAGHGFVRATPDDLDGWLAACDALYRRGATPAFWGAEAMLAATERLLAGTTTALSMLGGAGDTIRSDDPAHGRAHLAATTAVGIRSVLVVGPGAPPFPKETVEHRSDRRELVQSSLDDQLETVRALAVSFAAEPLGSLATTFPTFGLAEAGDPEIREAADRLTATASALGLPIVQDGHSGDTVRASYELGLLGQRSLLSHATDLEETDIRLLAETGAAVAHNPAAIYSQWGRCPVPELLDAGVTVGLGSDATAPDRSADMFRHMYILTRYHRADRRDPSLFPPQETLEMATMGSARALGMADTIGSLEVGKAADVIVVDAAKPHLTPLDDPLHQIVHYATGADVDTVVVNGVVRMRHREVTHLDVPAVLAESVRQSRLAWARIDP